MEKSPAERFNMFCGEEELDVPVRSILCSQHACGAADIHQSVGPTPSWLPFSLGLAYVSQSQENSLLRHLPLGFPEDMGGTPVRPPWTSPIQPWELLLGTAMVHHKTHQDTTSASLCGAERPPMPPHPTPRAFVVPKDLRQGL